MILRTYYVVVDRKQEPEKSIAGKKGALYNDPLDLLRDSHLIITTWLKRIATITVATSNYIHTLPVTIVHNSYHDATAATSHPDGLQTLIPPT